jgi:pilus assembly protein CpaC
MTQWTPRPARHQDPPYRLAQLQPLDQPGGAAIEEIRPPSPSEQGLPDRRQEADSDRLPFQPTLPPELQMQPPKPFLVREYGKFIPETVDPENMLNLIVGRPRILTFAQTPVRLYLPDEVTARYDIITDTEIAIVGLAAGSTVLTVWVNDPQSPRGVRVLSYLVRVFEDPEVRESLTQIEQQINETFPDSYVDLSMVRDRLVVRGEAKDAIEAAHILTILAQARQQRGRGVEGVEETDVYIDRDRYVDEEAAALRRSLIDPVRLNEAGIVNLLRIPGEQQVMLRVTVAEVNRSALRSIGADMQIGGDEVSFLSLVANTDFTPVPGLGNLIVDVPDFRLVLTALRELNLARTLAEPNLVALNGRSATFFAGDRVPLPAATVGFGAVGQGVRFDTVGVTLTFTPYIVERDRIRLQVAGSVSTLDESQGQTNIGGSAVSTQNARSFQTTVDLRDGETMAMAGLILNTLRSQASRVPLLGDLPVVGTLFTDKGNTYSEQELVVLVTPELAHPLDACRTPPLPGADVFEPTDAEFYLCNRLESRRSQDFRSTVRTDCHRLHAGEKRFCDPFIIGPSGHSYGCCDHQHQIAFPAGGTVTRGPEAVSAPPLESVPPPEPELAPGPASAHLRIQEE